MSDEELFYRVLVFIPIGLMAGCVVFGISRYSKLEGNQKLLVFLAGIALLTEIISIVLLENGVNTYPLFHIYAPIEYAIIVLIFANSVFEASEKKGLIISVLIVFVYGIANSIFWQSIKEPNTNITTVTSLLITSISIYSLFRILSTMKYSRVETSSFFWVVVGMLIYFPTSFMLFAYSNWLKPIDPQDSINVWVVHVIFNTIHYLCFNIALWMKPE